MSQLAPCTSLRNRCGTKSPIQRCAGEATWGWVDRGAMSDVELCVCVWWQVVVVRVWTACWTHSTTSATRTTATSRRDMTPPPAAAFNTHSSSPSRSQPPPSHLISHQLSSTSVLLCRFDVLLSIGLILANYLLHTLSTWQQLRVADENDKQSFSANVIFNVQNMKTNFMSIKILQKAFVQLIVTAIGLVNGNPSFSTPTESTSLNRSLKIYHRWLRPRILQLCKVWWKSVHGRLLG